MHRRTRWMAAVLMTALVTGAGASGCASAPSSKAAAGESPAKVEKIGDTGLSRLTLTEKAIERLAIATVPVTEGQAAPPAPGEPAPPPETFKVIPYAALLYQPDGATFVYTSPGPRTYVREAITVKEIDGDRVLLTAGPALGTEVVTTGAAELWGTEFKIGKY